jgi:hypothetical protein
VFGRLPNKNDNNNIINNIVINNKNDNKKQVFGSVWDRPARFRVAIVSAIRRNHLEANFRMLAKSDAKRTVFLQIAMQIR